MGKLSHRSNQTASLGMVGLILTMQYGTALSNNSLLPASNHNLPLANERLHMPANIPTALAVKPVDDTEERFATLCNFANKLLSNTKDLDPEIAQALDEKFWDLYEPF